MSAATQLRSLWERLSHIPGGKALFSTLFGVLVPYSGTIRPRVLSLAPGRATIAMADRHGVRNHLNSVHAIALMNLAEMTTGLAIAYAQPDTGRGIITGLSIEYVKKARGRLVATVDVEPPDFGERRELDVPVEIRDDAGELVARATARWLLGPIEASSS